MSVDGTMHVLCPGGCVASVVYADAVIHQSDKKKKRRRHTDSDSGTYY